MSDEIEDDEPMVVEDDGGGEDWLVSYADMMTLIACFFILMMAFANFDPVGFNIKAEKLSESFRRDKFKSSQQDLKFIREELTHHPEMKKKMKISVKDGELVVVFSGGVLFRNAEYKLDDQTIQTVDSLIDIIKTTNQNYRILVEGHADDDLEETDIQSNWHISSLRASSVIERFSYYGFPMQNLSIAAKGDTQKVVDSIDKGTGKFIEANAKMNRRVVIRVLEPRTKKKVKFGFGIYFRDSMEDVEEGYKEVNEYKKDLENNE
jgi:chemotaxis protein MotB